MNKKFISAAILTLLVGGTFLFLQATKPKELPCTKTIEKISAENHLDIDFITVLDS